MQMNRNQAKTFKKKVLSRTDQRYVSRTAIKVNTRDTRLDLFIARWITKPLVCSSCRSTAIL